MAKALRRTAAFAALGRALTAGARGGPGLGRRLAALPRMVGATLAGKYDGKGRLALMAAATAYVASPIDALPEIILLIPGLADDVLVATWLAGAVLSETERFLTWEDGRRRGLVLEGQVGRTARRLRK